MQLVDLRVGQHVAAFFWNADDGYVSIVAANKIQHVVDSFPLFSPMVSIFDKEGVFEYSVGDVLHQAFSCRQDVPFIIVNTWICSVEYNDSMRYGWLIDG